MANTQTDAERMVRGILEESLSFDTQEMTLKSRLVIDLGMDELDMFCIVTQMEEKGFGNPFYAFTIEALGKGIERKTAEEFRALQVQAIKTHMSHFYNRLNELDRRDIERNNDVSLFTRKMDVGGLVDYVASHLSTK